MLHIDVHHDFNVPAGMIWELLADFADIERCVAHCRTRLPTLKD